MREYCTHDNGGRPFCVKIDDDAHVLHVFAENEPDMMKDHTYATEPIYSVSFERVFTGDDDKGYAILAISRAGRRMHFIGCNICEFTLRDGDEFAAFRVRMGGSDVPFAWVEGTRNAYLMSEPVYLPNYTRGRFGDRVPYDAYEHFYGMYNGGCRCEFADGADCDHLRDLARLSSPLREYYAAHFAFAPEIIVGRRKF